MFTEGKKNRNYGSIFVYCFFCFVFVVGVAEAVNSGIETVVEEGFREAVSSGQLPWSGERRNRLKNSILAQDKKKLSQIVPGTRKLPPYTYSVKFQSFNTMAKLVKENGGKYESRPFSVGGYNWTFLIYPNADIPAGSGNAASAYVKIDNSSFINNPHDVYAEIKFVLYSSSKDEYMINQEVVTQRFHLLQQEWGLKVYVNIGFLENPTGFQTADGSIIFGVDINVVKPFQNWETFSYQQNIRDPIFDWKLTNFSTRFLHSYTSDPFTSGGRSWVLKVYPNGVGSGTGNSLSLFLVSATNESAYMEALLRVIDQNQYNHVEKQVARWGTEDGWGFDKFISFADIRNASKGFVVNDTIRFQVQIISFSKTEVFSR